jgi:hypothetical protein
VNLAGNATPRAWLFLVLFVAGIGSAIGLSIPLFLKWRQTLELAGWNRQVVTGLLLFGFVVEWAVVQELAIRLAYLGTGKARKGPLLKYYAFGLGVSAVMITWLTGSPSLFPSIVRFAPGWVGMALSFAVMAVGLLLLPWAAERVGRRLGLEIGRNRKDRHALA